MNPRLNAALRAVAEATNTKVLPETANLSALVALHDKLYVEIDASLRRYSALMCLNNAPAAEKHRERVDQLTNYGRELRSFMTAAAAKTS
jgi:hypothetical protein